MWYTNCMNNDHYNNQSNLTDNAPIASPGAEDVKQQWAFTETPMMKPLVAENIEKKKAFRWTVIFVIICLVSVNFFGITSDVFRPFIGSLGDILVIYAFILACVSVYWYKTGRYWITDKISKIMIVICCIIGLNMLLMFLTWLFFFVLIARQDVPVVRFLSTIGMVNLFIVPAAISLFALVYSSWAMLSYHKKSTSRLGKK